MLDVEAQMVQVLVNPVLRGIINTTLPEQKLPAQFCAAGNTEFLFSISKICGLGSKTYSSVSYVVISNRETKLCGMAAVKEASREPEVFKT